MKRKDAVRVLLVVVALAGATALSGCLASSTSKTEHQGRPVSGETLARVHPGMAEADVIALLGEPSQRTRIDEHNEILRWTYRTETRSTGSIFLLFSTTNVEETEGAVNVELLDGRVVKTWRDVL